MGFCTVLFHWMCVAILLVGIWSEWSGNYDRDGLALVGKRPPRDGKQGVLQAIRSYLISSLSKVFSFCYRPHDFAIFAIGVLGAQDGVNRLQHAHPHPHAHAHACVREALQAEMPREGNHMSPSPDLTKRSYVTKFPADRNLWQKCFVAAQESTRRDVISNSEHKKESATPLGKPNGTKDSDDSLSQDEPEIHGLVSFFMATRKEGVSKARRNKILLAMLVFVWVLLLVTSAALAKRRQSTKTDMKIVSKIRREDLLLKGTFFELTQEMNAKHWRRNKTDFAAWDYKLPSFEKNQGSTIFWVAPATLGQFLPTVLSDQGDRFQYMGYRLASLAALPSGSPVSPLRLAEAGFHYNPEASTSAVVCHECGVTYRLDSPSATILPPLLHHQRASPSCSVARSLMEVYGSSLGVKPSGDATQPQTMQAGDECETGLQTDGPTDMTDSGEAPRVSPTDSATRAEGSEERRTDMIPSQGFNGYTMALPSTSQDVQSYPGAMAVPSTNPGSSEKVYLDLNSAVYPLFGSLQSRLATFSKWPASSFRPPELLAPLGFFYAGYADCIRCFYCGIGLKTWEENDDPEEEHIRWRPNCQYVLATKGRRFVDRTLARLNQSGNNADETIEGQSSPARDTRHDAILDGDRQRSTPRHTPSEALSSQDRQQLLQMGFSEEMISSTQARLLASGQTLTVENMLALLVP